MNPYEILRVSSSASGAEIKTAYRKLVKEFHPDVYKGNHQGMIRQVNEAYDILSDPVRKAAYDGRATKATSFTYKYQEDPRAKQRREYIARRKAEARQKKEEYFRVAHATYKVFRYISFATLLLASLFIVDRYLPQNEYHEVAETGWVSRHPGDDSFSFMQTKHFVIAVPHYIHTDYDYDAVDKQVLTISISPILQIPSTVSMVKKGENHTAEVQRTIFSNQTNIEYVLLIASLFVVLRKNYSDFNLGMAMFPIFIMIFIWMVYF
jgi:hypothetical protein